MLFGRVKGSGVKKLGSIASWRDIFHQENKRFRWIEGCKFCTVRVDSSELPTLRSMQPSPLLIPTNSNILIFLDTSYWGMIWSSHSSNSMGAQHELSKTTIWHTQPPFFRFNFISAMSWMHSTNYALAEVCRHNQTAWCLYSHHL